MLLRHDPILGNAPSLRLYNNVMTEPTLAQLKSLYLLSYTLTNVMFQPILIVRVDERNQNLFILAGHQENIEIVITPNGEVF